MLSLFASFIGFSTSSNADNNKDFANNLATHDTKSTIQNMQKMFSSHFNLKDFYDNNENIDEVTKPKARLRVFVSSSMPESLLKNYAREAAFYNGVLVFRGLPNGAFRSLSDLVMSISDDSGNSAAMQIDDKAFSKYKVTSVPTIIVSKEAAFLDFDNDKNEDICDRVQGNVSIKYALELFAGHGELMVEAKELLQ